jgi:hypothetical protein
MPLQRADSMNRNQDTNDELFITFFKRSMIKNYLIIAWRNLLKNRLYSSINILGLATGMTVALLIALLIWTEFSFDKYHHKRDRIARVMSTTTFNGTTSTIIGTAVPLANELRNKYPEDFNRIAVSSDNKTYVLSVGAKKLSQPGRWVEPRFTEMFTFRMLKGNADLSNSSSILLARSLATALFGNADPINQPVLLNNKFSLTVTGVYEDIPEDASFSNSKFLMPWSNAESPGVALATDWNNHHSQLYVELNDQASFDQITTRIKHVTRPFIKGGGYEEILLHPMKKWLLYDEFTNGVNTGGRIDVLQMFAIIGLCILLLACINFMNLSTARSEKRAKEVGIRKAVGSIRTQLISQFLTESLLMVCLSSLLTIVLAQVALPYFNALADKNISIPWSNPVFWIAIIVFTIITGVISGSYPAFYLSGFKPIKVLKGTFYVGRYASVPRKVLVVIQFTVSITLIIGTLIVYKQVQYARTRPVGYSRESLITVNMSIPEIEKHYETFRYDLIKTGAVSNMAVSSSPSTNVNNHMMGFKWRGKDPNSVPLIGTIAVTHDFGETIGWKLTQGRDFSREHPSDSGSLILNEAAVRLVGFKNPIGETMTWGGKDRKITGVVQDMVMESPYATVQPTAFFLDYEWRTHVITLRINPALPLKEAIAKIKITFSKYYPENIFDYGFTDEQYEWKFHNEQRISSLVTAFAIITIIISCLGLFGLASFVAEQRTKEIGVRKVLGASVLNIWKLLSGDFVTLVFISTLIAIPIAGYMMNEWLQKYEYRTGLSWWIFALAGITALTITLLTVSSQAIKAAIANPVKSLRTE